MQGAFGITQGEPSAATRPPFTKVTSLTAPSSGDLDVTVDFLTEVDKLVQLIECPIFTCKEEKPYGKGWCLVLPHPGTSPFPAPPSQAAA